MKQETITELAQQLIQRPSFTPNDAGCQQIISDRLCSIGFSATHKSYGEVDNVFLWHGEGAPGLMFLGHTDVVPIGQPDDWLHDPLSGCIVDGVLYGRGAADMKGSVAAMVTSMEAFIHHNPRHKGKLALMLTSDEEGKAADGVRRMMPFIHKKHDINYCLVGEPSSSDCIGDIVRMGRRGSLHVKLIIHGKQGHVAYPHLANNPIFKAAGAIDDLGTMQWDKGTEHFPPTSFQISNINAGTGVANVIPGQLNILGNFRYCPESDKNSLEKQMRHILDSHNLDYQLEWNLSGEPFFCDDKFFCQVISDCIVSETGEVPVFNTGGGTSDGRFVAPMGVATLELGPINKTIHQVNECESVDNLLTLSRLYYRIIEAILL